MHVFEPFSCTNTYARADTRTCLSAKLISSIHFLKFLSLSLSPSFPSFGYVLSFCPHPTSFFSLSLCLYPPSLSYLNLPSSFCQTISLSSLFCYYFQWVSPTIYFFFYCPRGEKHKEDRQGVGNQSIGRSQYATGT